MTSPTTDAEYSSSARAALIQIARWLESPCALLAADAQIRFIQMTADVVLPVVNSEPHLRGTAVEAIVKAVEWDRTKTELERDRYRETARGLYDALSRQPQPRGIELRKDRERLIDAAAKILW